MDLKGPTSLQLYEAYIVGNQGLLAVYSTW